MEATDPRLALVQRFFAGTGSSYDAMVRFATLGFDGAWKRRIVSHIPRDATRVLDLACGTGISTLAIVRRCPQARVVGVELREEYLSIARGKLAALGCDNIELVLSRAEDYWSDEPFDCVSSSYLAKYADLERLVPRLHSMLRPGGVFIAHDFTYPPKRWLSGVWRLYFKTLQVAGTRLFPPWREIYYGLPELIERTRWLPELQERLSAAGFADTQVEHLFAYGSALVTARRP
jgi:demethylmenaquinone methyltransferase / 2-methoxy-6-polyprenyl-1,4-benzoquinol methylase